jgi:hypothetical protein
MNMILYISLALFGLGLYLLLQQTLDLVADLLGGLAGIFRRRFRPLALRRLMELQSQANAQYSGKQAPKNKTVLTLAGLSLWRPFWIAAAIIAALLLADSLRSPLALALILAGGELFQSGARSQRLQRLNEDASNLIIQFSSRYPLTHSVTKALKDTYATLPDREVARALGGCLARLQMNQTNAEAMTPLQALKHQALGRFAVLLANVQDTNQDIFMKTLAVLRAEVEDRLDLRRQARQSLTLVRGTTRVLQVVFVTAALVACLLPNWRAYFVASPRNWFLFMGMVGLAALGSFYMEVEMRQLEV